MSASFATAVLSSSVVSGTSLYYAASGELVGERAGIVNLGLEGLMLIGAAEGFAATSLSGNPYAGVVAAGIACLLANLIFGFLVIERRANQLASGLSLMFFGFGASTLIGRPFVGALVPALPRIAAAGVGSYDVLVWLVVPTACLLWGILFRTRWGLALRAVGEDPAAAFAAGRRPRWLQYQALALAGFLGGRRRSPSLRRADANLGRRHDGGSRFYRYRLGDLFQMEPALGDCRRARVRRRGDVTTATASARRRCLALPHDDGSLSPDTANSACFGVGADVPSRLPRSAAISSAWNRSRNSPEETIMTRLRFLVSALLMMFLAAPAYADSKLTVGAIYVGSINDYGYNRSMHDGLMAMKDAIPGVTVLEAENVPETAEAERIMEGMIQQGAKLIFATSFGHQELAFNLAQKHPDVVFEHAGGWKQSAEFRQLFRRDAGRLVPHGRCRRFDDQDQHAGLCCRRSDWLRHWQRQCVRARGALSQSEGSSPRGGDRQLVRQSQRGRGGRRADRPGRRRHRDACRFARDHHSGGGEPRRPFDWLPIGRSARACAQGLDYRPRLHLGSVHDRQPQRASWPGASSPPWSGKASAK